MLMMKTNPAFSFVKVFAQSSLEELTWPWHQL
jgi:hypothetical protein